ncbi:tryptophanase leader peptide [Escherichia coli]|nr:tryptophanase leader peptide [Escherichia coli]
MNILHICVTSKWGDAANLLI